ncbi:MAG TPA: SDR family oxidoreductase, partial [Mycobacteriales bacterium]
MPPHLPPGRRVLVTGAAGAFGSQTCALLRGLGARVVGLDTRPGEGVLDCDITDPDAVSAVVAEAVSRLGGLDMLVHYAGIGEPVDAGAAPDPQGARTLQVNLLGPWRVTAAALPALLATSGRVVFVASELAYVSLPFAGAYAVSKRGLTAYADALRMEYGTAVSVSTVYPGYVRTRIHDASIAAGLSMEGQVRAERVTDVVATVLRV